MSLDETQKRKCIAGLICVVIATFTVIAFWQLKDCGFVSYDDDVYVYSNKFVQQGISWDGIKWAFSIESVKDQGLWIPLTWISFFIDNELFGLNPSGYHLTNLLLHILNSLILFFIFQEITKEHWKSFAVAALFALHPLHVESVAWISERKDVLSILFFMLTIKAYVSYAQRKTTAYYLVSLILFTAGMIAKPMLVTLPFVLMLLDYWPLNRLQGDSSNTTEMHPWQKIRRIAFEKIPFLILSAVFSAIAYTAQLQAGAVADVGNYPLTDRIGNALLSYVIYLKKMLWPTDLAFFYPYPAELSSVKILGASMIIIALTGCAIMTRKKYQYILFGWLWYLITLLPVIGLIQIGSQAYADRYTYIPLIGIFVALSWGTPVLLTRIPHRNSILFVLTGLILFSLIIVTRMQVGYWQNGATLFGRALEVTDDNYLAHQKLAKNLRNQGKFEEAYQHLTEAVKIKPDDATIRNDFGSLLGRMGRLEDAYQHLVEAMRINPHHLEARNNMANILHAMGRDEEAIQYYLDALRINPHYAVVHSNLGMILISKGQIEEGKHHLYEAIRIKPDFADARFNVALILYSQGNLNEAKAHLVCSLQSGPRMFQAHYLLGKIAASQGRNDEAVQHFRDTLRLQPDFEKAKNDLQNLLNEKVP